MISKYFVPLTAMIFALAVASALLGLYHLTFDLFQPKWLGWSLLFWVECVLLFVVSGFLLAKLKEGHFLILMLLVAASSRVAWSLTVENNHVSDFAVYHELAAALSSGQGYAITGPVGLEDLELYIGMKPVPYTTAYRAPGVPLWTALLYKIFGTSKWTFMISNILFGVAASFLLFGLLKRSGFIVGARVASFFWGIYPTAVFATNLLCTEVPFVFSWLLTAFFLSQYEKKPSVSALAGVAFAVTLSGLFRAVLPLLTATVVVALFAARKSFPKNVFIFLIFIAAFLSPWTLRNWKTFHAIIPVCTNGGFDFYLKTRRAVPENLKDAEWVKEDREWEAISDEAVKSSEGFRLGLYNLKKILQGGPSYVKRHLKRGFNHVFSHDIEIYNWSILRSYFRAQYTDSSETSSRAVSVTSTYWWTAAASGFYLTFLTMAAVGAGRLAFRKEALPMGISALLLFFLLFVGAHLILGGQSRYHFTQMPLALILSCMGLEEFWRRMQRGNMLRSADQINH